MKVADVAIRQGLGGDTASLLKAILQASNMGILLTDLDHRSLACNAKFGEFFNVEPELAVSSGVEELRKRVFPLIADRGAWVKGLNDIYADPTCHYEDDLVLLKEPPQTIHRFTSPVFNVDHRLIGRLWTFTNVTEERRRQRMSDVLHAIGTLHDPNPANVYRRILDEVSRYYQNATALLSIVADDFMEFRAVAGPPSPAKVVRGNALKNSYCQFVLHSTRPVIVQDARREERYRDLAPSKFGMTRYLGVPIHDPKGEIVGTLCILDGHNRNVLDQEDVRFMTLLSMRVGAELVREAHIAERLADQAAVVRRKEAELEETRGVLKSMNDAFELLTEDRHTETLLKDHVRVLHGALGFSSNAILISRGSEMVGYAFSGRRATRLSLRSANVPDVRGLSSIPIPEISDTLRCAHLCWSPLRSEGRQIGLVAFGGDAPVDPSDGRFKLHLDALVDQINLLLSVHLLHSALSQAHSELRTTHRELVQHEKLSVVGTLAASTAHDIRNIMSALAIDLAPSSVPPDEALAAVRQQLDRFSLLAHRLLSYARPQGTSLCEIELGEVLCDVLGILGAQLRLCEVKVKVDLPRGTCLDGDRNQLEHVFVNLILNAIQAMPAGGEIEIKGRRDRRGLVVSVADTGKGIDAQTAKSLFVPFKTGRANGFGLGLFSCQRIVEEHGGRISVKSKLGKGTTFSLTFPAVEAR